MSSRTGVSCENTVECEGCLCGNLVYYIDVTAGLWDIIWNVLGQRIHKAGEFLAKSFIGATKT